jgi:hypothetical protein
MGMNAGAVMVAAGKTNKRGRLNTVDLLIEMACFVKNNIFHIERSLSTYTSKCKEVNCTEPSPSVRLPFQKPLS